MAKKVVFSFRGPAELVQEWRAWIDASGRTADDVAAEALEEYRERHPLEGDALTIYEARKRQRQAMGQEK